MKSQEKIDTNVLKALSTGYSKGDDLIFKMEMDERQHANRNLILAIAPQILLVIFIIIIYCRKVVKGQI